MHRTRRSNITSKERYESLDLSIDRFITPELSRDLIRRLMGRGWTLTRIADTIHAKAPYLRRVRAGDQSLSKRDVTALARAIRTEPLCLLFEVFEPFAMKAGMRELYESTRRVLEVTGRFPLSLQPPGLRKRTARTKAA